MKILDGLKGMYFENVKSSLFTPVVFISLNASQESIEFFKKLNNQLDNELNYSITITSAGKLHIKIFSKNWDHIINKWIPPGDKQRGLQQIYKW